MSDTVTNDSSADVIRLPQDGELILSTSPHIHNKDSITKIMGKVLICLIPVIVASVLIFGLDALRVIFLCLISCNVFEWLWTKMMRTRNTTGDLSASVTGVLLALNLPSTVPWWICVIGSFIAIIIAKEIFGGLGQNPFNPAAVARVALLIGFAGPMTVFPEVSRTVLTGATRVGSKVTFLTNATPMSAAHSASGSDAAINMLQTGEKMWGYFIGNVSGSLGETSALAILIGGLGLLAFRLIRWQIPAAMLGSTFIFTWIVNRECPGLTPGPLFHLLNGGMLIAAFFMATDMVTSPMTKSGAFVYGALIGIIACVIRIWGAYPEGVSFALVIMNALVPLIDKFCYKRPFGWTSTSASAIQMRRGEIK